MLLPEFKALKSNLKSEMSDFKQYIEKMLCKNEENNRAIGRSHNLWMATIGASTILAVLGVVLYNLPK